MNTHIKSFNIYDFRGIKNLKLNDLKGINIITGDNNSGKTSVLEVINYLSGVDSLSNLAYSTTRGVNDYNQANTRFLPYERIQYLFPIDQNSPVIHYCFEMNKKIDVKIEKKKAYDILPQSEIRKLQGYTFDKIKEQITKYDDSFIENTEEIEISYLKFLLDDKLLKEEKITQYSRIKRAESKFYINTVYVTPFKHTTNEVYLTEVLNNPKYYQEMIEVLKEFDDSIMSINADTHNLTNKKRYPPERSFIMLHPSYTDLIEAVNSGVEPGEQPVVQSRYSIVIAAAKRARQLIAGADPLVAGAARKKPLSTAVQELYEQKLTILPEEEELPEEASLTENDEAECGAKDAAEEAEKEE